MADEYYCVALTREHNDRAMRIHDVEGQDVTSEVVRLLEYFEGEETPDHLQMMLEPGGYVGIVLALRGSYQIRTDTIVGIATLEEVGEKELHMGLAYVDSAHRKQGVFSALVESTIVVGTYELGMKKVVLQPVDDAPFIDHLVMRGFRGDAKHYFGEAFYLPLTQRERE